MPRDQWLELEQIYHIVEGAGSLDAEDMLPAAPGSREPKWRRNVRNVLQDAKETGRLRWDGRGRYWLPSADGEPSSVQPPIVEVEESPLPRAPARFEEVWSDLARTVGGGLTQSFGSSSQPVRALNVEQAGVLVSWDGGTEVLPRAWFEDAWQVLSLSPLLTAQSLPEPAKPRAEAVLGLLTLLPYVESVTHPQAGVFRVDRVFSDADLASTFGVGRYRGIRYAGDTRAPRHIVFITRPGTNAAVGHPYRDRWESGALLYTGEGQRGDQQLTRGNLALSQARAGAIPVYGFVQEGPGAYRYLGRFQVEDVAEEQQPDSEGEMRRVYVFRMRPLTKRAGHVESPHPTEAPQPADSAAAETGEQAWPAAQPAPPAGQDVRLERTFEVEPPPPSWDWAAAMRQLVGWVEGSGYVFEPWQVAAYVTALRTKPFVILAGISGTGKSRLPQLVARECGQRCEVIPVRPDWTDSSDLLGYTDLTGAFRPGRLLQIALEAQDDPGRTYVVVLDEMNLARVEHYFAEVLSRIEDRRVENGRWVCKPLLAAAQLARGQAAGPPDESAWSTVCLPPNLVLVGTVNMDETTHSFSRKVLDRAFTLELSETRLSRWGPSNRQPDAEVRWPAGVLVPPFVSLAQASGLTPEQTQRVNEVIATLERLNEALRQAQLQVGYRVRDEIALFVLHAADVADFFVTADGERVDPLDLAVSMKVLPRVTGGSGAVRRVLHGLLAWAAGRGEASEETTEELVRAWSEAGRPLALRDVPYPRCAARLCLMWERLVDDGFTSYWL